MSDRHVTESLDDLTEALGPRIEVDVAAGNSGPLEDGATVGHHGVVVDVALTTAPGLNHLAHLVLDEWLESLDLSIVVDHLDEVGLAGQMHVVVGAVNSSSSKERAAHGKRHGLLAHHALGVVKEVNPLAATDQGGRLAHEGEINGASVPGLTALRRPQPLLEQVAVGKQLGRLVDLRTQSRSNS